MATLVDPEQNIWEEEEYNDKYVQFETDSGPLDRRKFAASSLNQLILRLTNPRIERDNEFVTTFLLTYIAFTTPERLFAKLLERLFVPQYIELKLQRADTMTKIAKRVLDVLTHWLTLRFEDFRKANLLPQVKALIMVLESQGEHMAAADLQRTLQDTVRRDAKNRKLLVKGQGAGRLRATSFGPVQVMMRYNETDIAKALTVIEDKVYKRIQPYELLNQAWAKKKLKYRAVNVLELIKRFNAVSLWISTCIIKTERLKDRIKIFAKAIRIASELDKLNNFNTCLSIISGINNASVSRLKFTKEHLSHKFMDEFKRIEEKLSAHGAYANYRNILKNVALPCVPYLGVYLTDLTFIEDGNPDMIDGLINWKKPKLVYKVISEVIRFQHGYYTFTVDNNLLASLEELQFMDEQQLYDKSLVLEPRGAQKKAIK